MGSKTIRRSSVFALLAGLLAASVSGCGALEASGVGSSSDGGSQVDSSAPTTSTVMITDPVDNAFTVEVPEGWDSVAYSSGAYDVHRNVVSSVSPDGKTVLFVGDPRLPFYWNPAFATDVFRQTADAFDFYEIRTAEPAEVYLPEYVTRKFGELPGFTITSVGPAPELLGGADELAASGLIQTAAEVRFTYEASGELIHALVEGWAMDSGDLWMTEVYGIATDRNVEDYRPMLLAMAKSLTTTPDYAARSQANHEQSMAQIQAFGEEMTRQHNANMAWIQQSAAAHQSRMEAIWAQGDASMQSYYDRMDSMDHTQRDFLTYINEEETVSGGSTGTRQVATGATNYWVNKYDGTYVGGDINFGDTQLRQMGLNPDDYEQVTVVK
ncbi:MAG: hypothetical protein IT190_06970 [Microbacteriaceae bacterium]|nr:hypothetical protein [Microbacteriaceae bacterium]